MNASTPTTKATDLVAGDVILLNRRPRTVLAVATRRADSAVHLILEVPAGPGIAGGREALFVSSSAQLHI